MDALDLITKVYGVLDRTSTRNECMSGAIDSLAIVPHEEQNCLWLDSDNGYNLAYRGMAPQVSAMARFDSDGSMTDYCYFFLFPYDSASRKTETQSQADFAGSRIGVAFGDTGFLESRAELAQTPFVELGAGEALVAGEAAAADLGGDGDAGGAHRGEGDNLVGQAHQAR